MKHLQFLTFLVWLIPMVLHSQNVIQLPFASNVDILWSEAESQYYSENWETEVVANVSQPTLLAFTPPREKSSDLAVIICPGGGMYAHSINSEGIEVAKWLNQHGITAFVLKYRLVPTEGDATSQIVSDGIEVEQKAKQLLPVAINDAHEALKYVRQNAEKYGISSSKIGLMGFSAGGAVTMGTTYSYSSDSRPDFIAPIYAWMNIVSESDPPSDAPPAFIACASDDPLKLAPASVQLYNDWMESNKPAELHMYAKGGHGFGMRKLNLPSDQWIVHFKDWLSGEGFLEE